MLKVGDAVKYKGSDGEIKSVLDDMIIVRLPDGKDYSLPYDAVTKNDSLVMTPGEFTDIMAALKPYLKNVEFLNDFAKEMSKAGVSELTIRNGAISNFQAKESYEEKLAKHKAAALAEAERKAKEEFERESQSS